jgi:nucleotide-binding universal stress UspA family protein
MALHEAPRDAILSERRRFRADAISVGWRGHGSLRRLIAGSVSRGVVARAGCAVLVVRSAPRSIRRFVAGYDGSPQARRALELLARLRFAPGVRPALLLVSVVPPLVEGARRDSALGKAQSAASRLRARGWRVRARMRIGAPLDQLLDAADGADSLVVGASSRTRVEQAVLGSVAAGVLDRSAVPVLIVP